MTEFERKKAILAWLHEHHKATVNELSKLCEVSEITLRRDLEALDSEGLINRFHGGAMHKSTAPTYIGKTKKNLGVKKSIGKKASEFVQDGDHIFLDCGSTVFQICTYLRGKKNVTVITNSLPILLEVLEMDNLIVHLIGGSFDAARKAVHGHIATSQINRIKADKAFLGADGVSLDFGISAYSEIEMSNSAAMAANARESYVMCDSSKLDKDSHVKVLGWESVSALVTDGKVTQELKKKYLSEGVNLVQPE